MTEVIVRYTGPFSQPTFNLNGDGDNLQISVREDGKERVVFTGNDFSQEKYKKLGGLEKEQTHFYDLRGLARPTKD